MNNQSNCNKSFDCKYKQNYLQVMK